MENILNWHHASDSDRLLDAETIKDQDIETYFESKEEKGKITFDFGE